MTCKDCINYDGCIERGDVAAKNPTEGAEKECNLFKNKADFVKVRCKDCTFRQPIDESRYTFKGKPAMVCIIHSRAVAEDGYCSYGKRRDT